MRQKQRQSVVTFAGHGAQIGEQLQTAAHQSSVFSVPIGEYSSLRARPFLEPPYA